ncbi:hypothetical protein [Olsenella uli]|uniref:hypothetical protein n=1 Tax=Olsenella uli TaxID=133926 RepID=UPI0012AC2341|nr:hypothetical protein [Olsenella uli]
MRAVDGTGVIRRVGPGFSAAGDDSWRDDGYVRDEDEFFVDPRVGRGILVAVALLVVLCAVFFLAGRA